MLSATASATTKTPSVETLDVGSLDRKLKRVNLEKWDGNGRVHANGGVQQRTLLRRVLRRVLETAFEKVLGRVLRRCLAVGFNGKKDSEKGS